MHRKHRFTAAVVSIFAAILPLHCLTASAADGSGMTFAIRPETVYFTESELKKAPQTVPAQMYILNYTGFSQLRLQLVCDDPLAIENGGFTLNEADGKHAFFEKHGSAFFTAKDDEGNPANVCLWYGPGNVVPETGVVRDSSASFLRFDVAVPESTPAGVYQVKIADGQSVNAAGQIEPDIFLMDEEGEFLPVPALTGARVIVEPAALFGDVNCDGEIDIKDAQCALRYYSMNDLLEEEPGTFEETALCTPYIHTAMQAADVTEDGAIDTFDVLRISKYNQMVLLEGEADWNQIPK